MPFTRDDIKNISDEEFDEAVKSLIDKGLIELVVENGKEVFRITSIGRSVYNHLDSNLEERN